MPARKLPKDYHELAESRGIKWLGPDVANVVSKTQWECNKGHKWGAYYNSIQQGTGCPYCAGLVRKTPKDYHALAKKRGFQWMGPEVPNVKTRTPWECEGGHRWEACFDAIRRGNGCPFCAGLVPKTLEDYYDLAKKKGIEWIGKECPVNSKINTRWRCSRGHEWEACYGNLRGEHACPHCAGKARKGSGDYHNLAKKRGLKWMGLEISNVHTKTKWECASGHQWQARFVDIRRGRGCPECFDMINGQPVSGPQRRICETLDGILNYPCGPYKIDVALPDKMIAIEYDSWYWHGNREEYDMQRDQDLIAAGWKMLHIKSNNDLPTQSQLLDAVTWLQTNKKSQTEIILDDWGKGSTFVETRG